MPRFSPHNSQRSSFAPILLIIIVVAVVAAGIWYWRSGMSGTLGPCVVGIKSPCNSPRFDSAPTATPGVLVGTDWKTYRNEKYGFEFKHPSDLSFETEKTGAFSSGLSWAFFNALLYDPKLGKNADCGYPAGSNGERVCYSYLGITFEIFPKTQGIAVERFLATADGFEKSQVGDLEAKTYDFHGSISEGLYESIYFTRGPYIFLVTTSDFGTLDNILPTLKFTTH